MSLARAGMRQFGKENASSRTEGETWRRDSSGYGGITGSASLRRDGRNGFPTCCTRGRQHEGSSETTRIRDKLRTCMWLAYSRKRAKSSALMSPCNV